MKVVVGWILVTRDGNGGLGSCEEHHGVGVKKDVKRGSEADCASLTWLQLTRQLLRFSFTSHVHIGTRTAVS